MASFINLEIAPLPREPRVCDADFVSIRELLLGLRSNQMWHDLTIASLSLLTIAAHSQTAALHCAR